MLFLLAFDKEEAKEKFSTLYREYAGFMLRVARRVLSNSADAEDVVQDAFLYIADNLEKIDLSDQQKTRSYLAIITEHKAIDHIRRQHPELPLEEQLQEQEEALMSFTSWEEGDALAKALLELSPEYREIILLRYWYGYSFSEIAKLFDQSYFSITSKANRAKQKLAQIIQRSE